MKNINAQDATIFIFTLGMYLFLMWWFWFSRHAAREIRIREKKKLSDELKERTIISCLINVRYFGLISKQRVLSIQKKDEGYYVYVGETVSNIYNTENEALIRYNEIKDYGRPYPFSKI